MLRGRKAMVFVTLPVLLVGGALLITKYLHVAKASLKDTHITPIPVIQEKEVPTGNEYHAPVNNHSVSFSVLSGDARPHLIKNFLESHKSPMAPYSDTIVKEADKNGFDYRLTTSIAMCESNAGKRMPTRDSYNAFGISVYTGQLTGARFRNWEHAISWVSDYIKKRYYDQGLVELIDIGERWAPPSVATGNSWALCVQRFMDQII